MKPRSTPSGHDDLFRARLDQILDLDHPLIQLANKIDWDQVDERVALCYADEGRPGLSPRLMVGLHYLKHAFDESDESVCERWVENPYWQYFCGEDYLQHALPIDPSSMTRWRGRVGEKLFSDLLGLTVNVALGLKLVRPKQLTEVAVDTTVQPKAIAHPTDARLYDKARRKLVEAARQEGVPLRQSYARKGPEALRRHGRYAHAKQFKRARRERKKLRNFLGRILREFERNGQKPNFHGFSETTEQLLTLCGRLYRQQTKDKNKLYALHAPEVVCMSKGKARTPYEFGSKVSVTTTLTGGWALDCTSLYGNPYDGHTLSMRLLATELRTGVKVGLASVDQGYRGHETDELLGVTVLMPKDKKRKGKRLSRSLGKKLKRRNAIEPTIGHLKHDHRMGRCCLKGEQGDQINALAAAMGLNLRKLLAGLGRRVRCAVGEGLWWLERLAQDHAGPANKQSTCG
ncbi:MAG: IS5 family transposase [Litorivicinus sp.]